MVELIEKGALRSEATRKLLEEFLEPMIAKNIDYLVLGCTHYPYLIPVLKELLPDNVKIIDSGQAVARQTKAILNSTGNLNNAIAEGKHQFFTNTDSTVLKRFVLAASVQQEVSFLDF